MNILIFLVQYATYGLVVGFPLEEKRYYESSTIRDLLPEDPIKAGHENNKTHGKDLTNAIGERYLPEFKVYETYGDLRSGAKMQTNVANEVEISPTDAPPSPLIIPRLNNLGNNNISHQLETYVMNIGNNKSEEYTDDELDGQLNFIFGPYNETSSTELPIPNDAEGELNDSDIGPHSGEHNVKSSNQKVESADTSADAYFPIERAIPIHAALSNSYIIKTNESAINRLDPGLEMKYDVSSAVNLSQSLTPLASENSPASLNQAQVPEISRAITTIQSKTLLNNTRTNNTSTTFKPNIILISLIFFIFYYNHY